ncbi:unnamed protein product [Callosobruchus maculatus]|uniref:Uncharacterized protein n=1 Tax=Callosobruchus maculatus TaxID=64391 RepID=A0A653DMV7_CALMS|nr:unnamed protein product [Callosobruchus maculatus]
MHLSSNYSVCRAWVRTRAFGNNLYAFFCICFAKRWRTSRTPGERTSPTAKANGRMFSGKRRGVTASEDESREC